MIKKRGLLVLLTILLVIGLIGCSEGSSSSTTQDSAGRGDSEEDSVLLKGICPGTAADGYTKTYQEIADEFSANNEYGAKVEFEFYEVEQFKTKLTTLMAANDVRDIFFTWELDFLRPFVEGGKVYSLQEAMDADPEWKDRFLDGVLEPLTFDGELYAVPAQTTFCVMFYNKQIFEENGVSVPTTYEEFLDVCETLKNNGVTPLTLAASVAWIPAQLVQQISNGIAGIDLYDGICEGTRKWNDPEHVEAAKEAQTLVEKGYFQDGMLGMAPEEARSIFMNGNAAMFFMGIWEVSTFIAEDCPIRDHIGTFILPAINSEHNYINVGSVDTSFGIAETCKHKDAAVEFLKHFTSESAQEAVLYKEGRLPATKIEIDESKVAPLVKEVIELSEQFKGLTPWWDRAFGAGEGVEFNNACVAVFAGEDPQGAFDALQSFAEQNVNR